MSDWDKHIASWFRENGYRYEGARDRTVAEIGRILSNDGWNKSKYAPHMKDALYKYLNAWFVLEIKKMPPVATKGAARRRNPEPLDWCPNCSCFSCRQVRDYY